MSRPSFLGTRFENLCIAGHPVALDLDFKMLGSKPANDAAYTQDSGLISCVSGMLNRIRAHQDLPATLRERYNQLASTLGSPQEEVECSLVKAATGDYPGASSGHVITIPDFGTIILGKVTIKHEDFKPDSGVPRTTTVRLKMIEFHFGCAIAGASDTGDGSATGQPNPKGRVISGNIAVPSYATGNRRVPPLGCFRFFCFLSCFPSRTHGLPVLRPGTITRRACFKAVIWR